MVRSLCRILRRAPARITDILQDTIWLPVARCWGRHCSSFPTRVHTSITDPQTTSCKYDSQSPCDIRTDWKGIGISNYFFCCLRRLASGRNLLPL